MDKNTPSNYGRNLGELRNAIHNLVTDAIEDTWAAFESWELPQRVGSLAEMARDEVEDYFSGEFPKIDMRDTGKAIIVEADLPGVDPENVDIEIGEDSMLIAGMAGSEMEEESEDHTYYSFERHYGTFERIIALPDFIDPDQAIGEMKNGTLVLTLPKLSLKAAPKKKKATTKKKPATKKKSTTKKAPAKKKLAAKKSTAKKTTKTAAKKKK